MKWWFREPLKKLFENIAQMEEPNYLCIIIPTRSWAQVGGVKLMKSGIPAPDLRNFTNPDKLYLLDIEPSPVYAALKTLWNSSKYVKTF